MWRWNDGTGELYHYGVKGMKWGVRKNRILSGVSKGISNRVRKNNETFSDRVAYRTGGSEALKRNQASRQLANQHKKSMAYRQASGKKKAEMILKELGSKLLEGPKDMHGNSHNKPYGNI